MSWVGVTFLEKFDSRPGNVKCVEFFSFIFNFLAKPTKKFDTFNISWVGVTFFQKFDPHPGNVKCLVLGI